MPPRFGQAGGGAVPGFGRAAQGQKLLQHGAAGVVPGGGGQIARLALKVHALGIKRGSAGLGQRLFDGGALAGPGGLHGPGQGRFGPAARAVGGGQGAAAFGHGDREGHRHPLGLPAVKLPDGGHGRLAGGGVLGGAHAEHGAADFSLDVAVGEAGAGEHILQLLLVKRLPRKALAAGVDGGGHILRPPQPAFNFDAGHPGLGQSRQAAHGAQVFQGQMGRPGAVRRKGQTAGAGALAPVAAAPAQKGAHVALAGHRHAQRPVDEHLDLDGAFLGDGGNFGKAQLPGQDGPLETHFRQLPHPGQGVDGELGGAVEGEAGGHLPRQGGGGQVLHDEGVHPGLGGHADGVGQKAQFAGKGGGIHRRVDAHVPRVAKGHRLFQLLCVKIAGGAPGAELLEAQIHRVCPGKDGGPQGFAVPRRGQHLHRTAKAVFLCQARGLDGVRLAGHGRLSRRRCTSFCRRSTSRRACSAASLALAASSR